MLREERRRRQVHHRGLLDLLQMLPRALFGAVDEEFAPWCDLLLHLIHGWRACIWNSLSVVLQPTRVFVDEQFLRLLLH